MTARALDESAAQAALQRQLAWARRGTSALHLLLQQRPLDAWQHYPQGDIIDTGAGWQLYAHAHPAHHPLPPDMAAEAAHLHLFQRSANGELAHLAGLALDARGQPLRWFTTNLWVTGGRWLDANASHDALLRASWRRGGRLSGVVAWVHDLIHAYRYPLGDLLQQRDAALQRRLAFTGQPMEAALQDRGVSLLSCLPLNWPDELIDGAAQACWAYRP